MASDTFTGSCLCGSVKYQIVGEFRFFPHCHCSRCRKSTGTGHASNVIVTPESCDWTAGEELITTYKVPDAERFRTVFCSKCGSPLPRWAPDMSMAVIPAGTLDSHPHLKPSGRIFYDSKTDWSCDTAELETWAEYPQRP
ncbi:MAG: GFA family protein [Woeseiaceae bacterium]|nr:GFA family protein [Woeseiaceae bacterium]